MFLNPKNVIEAINIYLKQTGQMSHDITDIGALCRIVFESLAMKYRYTLKRLMAGSSKAVDVLHIIGGGSQNQLLNQLTANSINIWVIAGPVEATAAGNIMMQAYGMNNLSSLDEIREIVKNSFAIVKYAPQNTAKWDNAYKEYLKVTGLGES